MSEDLAELDRLAAEALGWPVMTHDQLPMDVGNYPILIIDCSFQQMDKASPCQYWKALSYGDNTRWHPSTTGQQAMDLLMEHGMTVGPTTQKLDMWQCTFPIIKKSWSGKYTTFESTQGATPEIAICRAVVAAKS